MPTPNGPPTLTLDDLQPGMRVRVQPGPRTWWHPHTRGFEGKVVTVLGREDDPGRVWSDPMAGGLFYVEECPLGFSVAAIVEIVERPAGPGAPATGPLRRPPAPGAKELLLDGHLRDRDFPAEAGDLLRVPSAAQLQTCRERLTRRGNELLEVQEVRAVAWQVRFVGQPDDVWWHTRGFVPVAPAPGAGTDAQTAPEGPTGEGLTGEGLTGEGLTGEGSAAGEGAAGEGAAAPAADQPGSPPECDPPGGSATE